MTGPTQPHDSNAAPYQGILKLTVEKMKQEPFLFVIAVAILLIGLLVLPLSVGTEIVRLTIFVIASLAFLVIMGYFFSSARKGQVTAVSGHHHDVHELELCGDAQIDQVTVELRALPKPVDPQQLLGVLSHLFARDAFDNHIRRNQGYDRLLFVITKTQLILRRFIPVMKADLVNGPLYQSLVSQLLELRRLVSALYGPDFDMAKHIDLYHASKDAFLKNLPALQNQAAITPEHWEAADKARVGVAEINQQLFEKA